MPRFVSATYHASINVAEFICDDGRHLLRCGGTLPWRINNAGDLVSPVDSEGQPAPKKTKNYIGFASLKNKETGKLLPFFIFPDYETGREQMALSVRRVHANKAMPELVQSYVKDSTETVNRYLDDLLKETGISKEKKVSELTEDEYKKLLDGIEKLEGYQNKAQTRKEVWIPVSRITATDGTKPLADEEIVLRIDGKDTTVKTNEYGQTPPIPHPGNQKVEVLRKQPSGAFKSVGTISGDKGQHFGVITWLQHFFATPAPNKVPDPATPAARRAAMAYVVQPKDTLGAIAKRFSTSVEQIKQDNHLKNDKIFPGQSLSLYGVGATASVPKPPPKKAAPNTTSASGGTTAPPAETAALTVRADAISGKPIAVVRTQQNLAPWMTVAYREATTYEGKDEKVITKTHNYHRLVTDNDRAGGRLVDVKNKEGKVIGSRRYFDGLPTLVGDHFAWCASFVNYCLKESSPPYPPGRHHMGAGTFLQDIDLFVRINEPIYGAIRYQPRKDGWHVCFV